VALILCTVVLFKMKRERFAWVTVVPTIWLLACTLTAGWQNMFDPNPKIGFLAQVSRYPQGHAAAHAGGHDRVFGGPVDAAGRVPRRHGCAVEAGASVRRKPRSRGVARRSPGRRVR
ncbi:hypothetical protein LLG90_26070, partial [Aromatoleum toluclasticum]|uniref:carbon starvation CstA family protein n=1 Tax=Aromatoleum toluclasticum TaxID=92003 RepID=UPI001D18F916